MAEPDERLQRSASDVRISVIVVDWFQAQHLLVHGTHAPADLETRRPLALFASSELVAPDDADVFSHVK